MVHKMTSPGRADHAVQGRSHGERLTIPFVFAVVTLLLILPISEVHANCQDLLGSRTYQCKVKTDKPRAPNSFNDCIQFTSPGEETENFDMTLGEFTGIMACACKAGGGFSDPEFGDADSFHCVSVLLGSTSGLAFEGTVKRRGRRVDAEAVNDGGDSFIFRCDRVRDCELPLSTLGAPSAY